MQYLGLWVARDGVKSMDKKIEAIEHVISPASRD